MIFGFVNLGVKELILILVIVLVIFGPRKLPEIGRSFGEMLKGFRKGAKEADGTTDDTSDESKDNNK